MSEEKLSSEPQKLVCPHAKADDWRPYYACTEKLAEWVGAHYDVEPPSNILQASYGSRGRTTTKIYWNAWRNVPEEGDLVVGFGMMVGMGDVYRVLKRYGEKRPKYDLRIVHTSCDPTQERVSNHVGDIVYKRDGRFILRLTPKGDGDVEGCDVECPRTLRPDDEPEPEYDPPKPVKRKKKAKSEKGQNKRSKP